MDGVEVYALAGERTRSAIERFVVRFGPVAAPAPEAFPYPQFDALPTRGFGSLGALLDYLEATPGAVYALYWAAIEAPAWPRPLMAFFTADGALVLGAVVSPARVPATLAGLAADFGARHGRTDTMLPPESTSDDFTVACRAAAGTRLVDGVLVDG